MTASEVRPSQHAPPAPAGTGRVAALRADLGASLVVFLVAVPLSLGIALASGAPIMAGIIAAVVGGVVAGLLGGSPLQVSGPAAGLTVVVAELVARFGWQVTCLITVGAGLLQIVFGLLRVARFSQAIPPAVVHGMLAGIGLTIALGQLHVVLGATPPTSAVDSVLGLPARLLAADPAAAAVGGVTLTMLLAWPLVPKVVRAVPGPLVAVVAATAVAVIWPAVPRVDLPGGLLESIALPSVLPTGDWTGIVGGILTVALIASVESLLSAVAVDRLRRPDGSHGPRTRPDRELIGQGAANGVSGLLGGLPVTGVIVRSSANVRAGARTRAATVFHGVWIAVFAIFLIGIIELVPLAALAGLLIMVGLQLVKPADMAQARRHGDLAVYVATIVGVLALNLLEGVGVGLAVAAFLMLRRALSASLQHEPPAADGEPHRVIVGGTLSFLSVPSLARTLGAVPAGAPVQVDLVVDYLDHAAYDHLDTWTARHRASGAPTEVTEPADAGGTRRGRYATWSQWPGSQAKPLLTGVAAFHEESVPLRSPGSGQAPSGLLLTCADSRVVPSVITRSGPGDLFTVQNVGNLVAGTSVRAAVQYATTVLEVPTLAVCGHSGCGAMRGLLDGTAEGALGDWLRAAAPSLEAFRAGHPVGVAALRDGFGEAEALAMVNVAVQLDALEHTGAGLVGLFSDIPTARVLALDREAQEFRLG
ncbi:SulP family inorganic anion transporter [Pseudonocardia abyssalis]|uniref:Bifunctional SulP family inorganic anion transporter/carbonic anhydrase n=1 Tax=Pseudonocardia abyssalis TaxID=2792008 RepID=A0ABS6UMG8_9PSEU|nr:SulP family inorganic anion transporter [Pseudonocardia abyssalis]MBW0117458.1 bifunctional SulP family inorganic anion transporter/carbonic anhydrase [Pseudonocardia abyssalis]MBW0133434.1 bifunctional SulP family inorganic anion transporter/carbonic anhydrase [Pseudonocardia abyssalis]